MKYVDIKAPYINTTVSMNYLLDIDLENCNAELLRKLINYTMNISFGSNIMVTLDGFNIVFDKVIEVDVFYGTKCIIFLKAIYPIK